MTSLVNHHPVNIIISIDIAMSDSYAKCFVTIAFHIHLYYLSFAGVLYHAIVREHLALTAQHNLVFWYDNVYWMIIDKWCHIKNLGLEDFLWAYPSTLKKINRKIIIKYMAHIQIIFWPHYWWSGYYKSIQVNMHLHCIGPLIKKIPRKLTFQNSILPVVNCYCFSIQTYIVGGVIKTL